MLEASAELVDLHLEPLGTATGLHRADGGGLGVGAVGRQATGHLERTVQEFRPLDHLAHEAHGQRLVGLDHAGTEDHLHGAPCAHDAGQALGSAIAGDEAERDLGQPHAGGVGGDADVAGQGQFETATHGSILLDGTPIDNLPPHKRGIGMVFQNYALFPHMTVGENLAFPLEVRKMGKAEVAQKVRRALDMVQMGEFAGRRPAQLSGGQQQRAAIARGLCMEPEALLFDEPTSALDPELEQEVVKVIKDLAAEGRTMMIVTHDMKLAADVSDHVVFLHQGLIEEQGAPEDLFGAPKSERLRGFLSATHAE